MNGLTPTNRTGAAARAGRRLAHLETILLALAAPFLLFPGRWAPLAILPLLLPWIGRLLWRGRLTRPSPLNTPATLILLMAFAGYSVSVDRSLSWAKLWGIVLQVAVFFAVLNGVRSAHAVPRATWLLLAGTAAITLLGLLGTDWGNVRLLSFPSLYENLPRLDFGLPNSGLPRTSALFHPREVGATLAFLLPAPLALALWGAGRRLRAVAAAVALPAAILLFLTQALSAFLGLALALTFLVFCRRHRTLALILPALLAGLLTLPFFGVRRLLLALLDPNNVLGIALLLRLDMWSRALAMLGDVPLTGIGLNTFPLIQSYFYPGLLIGPEPHAHNLFLQTALDLGLPGLVGFLWLAVAFFVVAYRIYRRGAHRPLLLGLTACFLSYLAGGLFDVVALGAKPPVALWFTMGLVAALDVRPNPRRAQPTHRPPAISRAAGLFILLLFLATGVALLVASGPAAGNLAAVRAHRVLYAARNGRPSPVALERARATLERALQRRPHEAHFHGLLGSLRAWQGHHAAAVASFRQRVTLNGPWALPRHAPFVAWRRRIHDAPPPEPWSGTLRLYRAWQNRFPRRAENYLLQAIILAQHLDRPQSAQDVVQTGLRRGAQPAGLLSWYLRRAQNAALRQLVAELTAQVEEGSYAGFHNGFSEAISFSPPRPAPAAPPPRPAPAAPPPPPTPSAPRPPTSPTSPAPAGASPASFSSSVDRPPPARHERPARRSAASSKEARPPTGSSPAAAPAASGASRPPPNPGKTGRPSAGASSPPAPPAPPEKGGATRRRVFSSGSGPPARPPPLRAPGIALAHPPLPHPSSPSRGSGAPRASSPNSACPAAALPVH